MKKKQNHFATDQPLRPWKISGFSFVELVIVLAILTVGCALAYPGITRWIEHYRLRTTAQQLVSDLQFVKMKAITEKVQHRISFNNTGKAYTIERGNLASGSTIWTQIGIIRQFSNETNPYYAQGVDINNNFTNDTVIFSPSGTTSPAGTITFSTANYTKNVVVSLSGRINVN